jgi:hypothetical protein
MSGSSTQHRGTIATGQTQAIVNLGGSISPPHSFGLKSTAGGRLIEVSVDGTNFFSLTPTTVTAAIMATFAFPLSAVRFTGAAGDTYTVL